MQISALDVKQSAVAHCVTVRKVDMTGNAG